MIEERVLKYSALRPFGMDVKYVDILPSDPLNTHNHHIHSECEIYINLSGDVSFMVENRIYPIKRGSVIITRPCEYHHCIYHADIPHKHFWMLFDGDGNKELFKLFYNRPSGTENLLEPSEKDAERMISLCFDMVRKERSEALRLSDFFTLLSILESSSSSDTLLRTGNGVAEPSRDIALALNYIGENLSKGFTVRDVAEASHVSVNTLERRFLESLHLTPSAYIKKRRLARAAELLPTSDSVGEVCEKCGFSDYSNFIALFKKQFGITPNKYRRLYSSENGEREVLEEK